MREEPVSSAERQFIAQGILDNTRLDGRNRDEFRPVKLIVGSEVGTALCALGNTKVFCSVSGQLTEPMRSRPAKGLISVDVDMSPMANPHHQHNRLGAKGIEIRRMLETVLRDSRCVDVESLCVRTGKQVWKLIVSVKVLDDDGGLLDCACVAAVTALHHYRRPNITVEPQRTIVHSEYEQALIPLNIHHMPICVMYGFTNDGNVSIVDPNSREEKYLDGCLWIACNKRKEICALHQTNRLILSTEMIENCVRKAFQRAIDISELIHTVCTDDSAKRAKNQKPAGFDVTVDVDFLNTNESQPDELIAPAVSGAALSKPLEKSNQPSMILMENPLKENAVSLDERNEDKNISEQVDKIVSSVGGVNITSTSASKILSENKGEVGGKRDQRKNERRGRNKQKEINDALDLLDDLSGETSELAPDAVFGNDVEMAESGPAPCGDLVAGKQNKK